MKKYKLVQKYPSLASDWEPGMEVGLGDRNYGYSPCSGNYTDCRKLDNNEVENNPEFWQEVVDHEFEIISFKQDSGVTDLWTKFREGWSRNVNGYPVTGPYSTEAILENSLYKIHSVKRLSDGEVFTVGDKVKVTEYGSIKNVDGFTIRNGISFLKEGAWIFYDKGMTHLDGVKKAKNPIFLTHDGEDIFEGDKVWYVNKQNHYKSYFIASKNQSFFSDRMAYFLTREAAEDMYVNEQFQ